MSATAAPGGPATAPAATLRDVAQEWWTDVKSGELGSLPIIIGLILIAIVFQSQNDRFLTAGNFVNLIVQSAAFTTIAMGIVFVLLLGEIDLSVGYVSGVAGVVATVLRLGKDVARFKVSETTQQEVVQAITAGTMKSVPGQDGTPA